MKVLNIIVSWLASNHELGIVVNITAFLAITTNAITGDMKLWTLIIAGLVGLVTLYGKVRDEIDKQKKRS